MRIIRQRRRLSVHKIKRRRRWPAAADANLAVASGRADSDVCRCWPVMADPVYNLLIVLVIVAAIVSILFYTTLTILPRVILVMGLLACIWSAVEGIWGHDQIQDL